MNENNAAQPLLTDDEIEVLCDEHDMPPTMVASFVRAIESALLSKLRAPVAGEARPVAWVAADTLNSPHPTCISSLAYMSQIDRERGREYVPLTIIDRYAAPVAAQTADDARDAARWRTAVKNWRVKNVEVFDGVTLTNRSGIHWDDLIRQVDAAMQRTSGREGE